MSFLNISDLNKFYNAIPEKYNQAFNFFNHPLTLVEKILFGHLATIPEDKIVRGETYVYLKPERIAMQDATAQMAILQFMQAKLKTVACPTTVHCDHLIQARVGASQDLTQALTENSEVYDFLMSASQKHGIGFWKPGSGIIHQVILENYAYPGSMLIGTDSHTPNAGGLATIAIGVGGSDAVDVMASLPWGTRFPKIIGIELTGKLNGWTSPKDIILKVASLLTVSGGTGAIIEYFGEGTKSISCTGKATITNMGAELGATTSIFPYDENMEIYLKATDREDIAQLANKYKQYLVADPEIAKSPHDYFDKVLTIDLNTLEPHVVGPHTPDLARPISAFKEEIKAKGYPDKLSSALIGSCTNSSYEDMNRSASVANLALKHNLKAKCNFLISPGSEQIHQTIKRDGQMESLENIGGVVLANACGPCIGQWKRDDIKEGELNSIVTSFNRNFQKRNDGNPQTLAFIASPEMVTAFALAGKLSFNPLTDTIPSNNGENIKLTPPHNLDTLPQNGFIFNHEGYIAPAKNPDSVKVIVKTDSDRLQLLEPFKPWNGKDYLDLPVLFKAKGKCTTDHISPAGKWLKFRGHLDKISDNMFIGAINAFCEEPGNGIDCLTQEKNTLPQIARNYKKHNLGFCVIGDSNYGEGSSREHAAMSPRFLGCHAVIVRSFARIHETNLKKQGILALTFANANDYELIKSGDKISITGLTNFSVNKPLNLSIKHVDGSTQEIQVNHTYTKEQIEWFKAGSALNTIAMQKL